MRRNNTRLSLHSGKKRMNNVFSSNTNSKKNKNANGFNSNASKKAFDSFIKAFK